MLLGLLFLLLFGISGLVGLSVVVWCARLALTGKWKQGLSIVVIGSLTGLLAIGLLLLVFIALGGTSSGPPKEAVAAIFFLGFSWGSFATAVSLGLWPIVKRLVYQSRRWADRR